MGISPKMKARLESIDRLVLDGYRVKKIYNAWPELATLSGVPKNITISNPAGFSWIAFFFPFAVYAQIKEWSYFYVAGFVSLGGSVLNKIVGWDPSMLLGLALGLQYGIFFPYLRWIALQENRTELAVGPSIAVGLLMSAMCTIPSIALDALLGL
jgi:hypothetical protein